MKLEAYERLHMDVTQFDVEDVITTSDITPTEQQLVTGDNELGLNIPISF